MPDTPPPSTPCPYRLLVANRGEIAIRIMRAAAELGIESVAIYSDDEADAPHRARADASRALGARGARAYLDADRVVAIAKESGCDLLHPGYGFLSESAAFARECAAAGIIFVGPTPEALELFGDKAAARALAARLDVPVLPGSGAATTLEAAQAFFAALPSGASMAIKALMGGGGRGIRIVHRAEDVAEAYARCQSEAAAAFGNGAVYVERALPQARHVEIQVAGDAAGEVVAFGDRECTLQRRHQKLMEIAPSPSLTERLREQLTIAAVAMGRAAGVRSLTTFEFLVDASAPAGQEAAFFIEANPRLQVEHTVTEEVTGLDLVHLQIQLAMGATLAGLGLSQAAIPAARGFAVQARVNMETMDADGTTRPSGGVLVRYDQPAGRGIRTDGFAHTGYRTTPAFDSLLAKVIAHSGAPRLTDALARLDRALAEFTIEGVPTSIPLLRAVLRHPDVRAGAITTSFIDNHAAALVETARGLTPAEAAPQPAAAPALAGARVDPNDPLAVLGQPRSAGRAGAKPEPAAPADGSLAVASPMQGTIVTVEVREGDPVRRGQQVAVMEAMKMEHEVRTQTGGHVVRIGVAPGDTVYEGHPLLFILPTEFEEGEDEAEDAADLDHIRDDLRLLLDRAALTRDEARPKAVARRRATSQRTARENLHDLCDGTFLEYGTLAVAAQRSRRSFEELLEKSPADGLVAGIGSVNGDLFADGSSGCAVLIYDYTVFAGTQGHRNHKKMDRVLDIARRSALPVVIFTEGGGGRPGDTEHEGGTETFRSFPVLSGLVPMVGINSGRCFAGNAALLGMCDVIIATADSNIGMGGPAMVEGGGLGVFAPEEIGPMDIQAPNGVVDVAVADEQEAIRVAKQYLSYFQGALSDWEAHDQRLMRGIVPENRLRAYDIRRVIETIADIGSVLELRRDFGKAMITALIRIEGRPLGLIANNPAHLSGAIDADAADKGARFLQLCDAFDLPVLSLCDTPGIMVGPEVEKTALVRHVARLFVIGANLTVPLYCIVLRKWTGLGALGMQGGSREAAHFTVAWPTGETAPMGLEGSVKLGYRDDLAAIADPAERKRAFDDMVAKAYDEARVMNTAGPLFRTVDEVIDPAVSREWVARMMSTVRYERRDPLRKRRPAIDAW